MVTVSRAAYFASLRAVAPSMFKRNTVPRCAKSVQHDTRLHWGARARPAVRAMRIGAVDGARRSSLFRRG